MTQNQATVKSPDLMSSAVDHFLATQLLIIAVLPTRGDKAILMNGIRARLNHLFIQFPKLRSASDPQDFVSLARVIQPAISRRLVFDHNSYYWATALGLKMLADNQHLISNQTGVSLEQIRQALDQIKT